MKEIIITHTCDITLTHTVTISIGTKNAFIHPSLSVLLLN
jgi:hypothetical protein